MPMATTLSVRATRINKIAKKFATKVDSIEAENPGLNPTKLRVGQKIKIPKK